MNVLDIIFNKFNITISVNIWVALAIVVLLLILNYFIFRTEIVEINEIPLGSFKLIINKKNREIAYKIWVELNTRKIGIPFDEENDVIIEIYNSWYAFFLATRELIKDIPPNKKSKELIDLTTSVLNECIRPHLTKWQARFRKWYNETETDGKSPQEKQKTFENYEEIVDDIKIINKAVIEYGDALYKIAFKNKK